MRLPRLPLPFLDVRAGERGKTLGMFFYFLIVVAAYWFMKPLRSALTVEQLGADAIRELKMITAVVSAGVVAAYSVALVRFSRERLTFLVLGAFFWTLLFFWFFFRNYGTVKVVYYCFYVFLDLFMTVNVALFWTFLADIVRPESAARLYGVIGAGGVIGGVVGSYSNTVMARVSPADLILYVVMAYSLLFGIVTLVARRVRTLPHVESGVIARSGPSRWHDAVEGARLVARTPYFLGICVVLASYEFISTVDDFALHKAVDLVFRRDGRVTSLLGTVLSGLGALTGRDVTGWFTHFAGLAVNEGSLRSFFSEFFFSVNLVALIVQALLTSLVVRKFGMRCALLVLPLIVLAVSTGFLLFPAFVLMEVLFLSDNALNYSINQTSREMLFVPVPREDKYRALAFIDMLVLRVAKATGGFLLIVLPVLAGASTVEGLRWCMLLTIPLAVVCAVVSIFLSARYNTVSNPGGPRHEP